MTCDSPFIKDTWADQAWKHYSGCSDKKEESRPRRKHKPISAELPNFKARMMKYKCMPAEEIFKECGIWV